MRKRSHRKHFTDKLYANQHDATSLTRIYYDNGNNNNNNNHHHNTNTSICAGLDDVYFTHRNSAMRWNAPQVELNEIDVLSDINKRHTHHISVPCPPLCHSHSCPIFLTSRPFACHWTATLCVRLLWQIWLIMLCYCCVYFALSRSLSIVSNIFFCFLDKFKPIRFCFIFGINQAAFGPFRLCYAKSYVRDT